MTIGTNNKKLEKPTKSEIFIEAENNNKKESILEGGIIQSIQINDGVQNPVGLVQELWENIRRQFSF